MFQFVMVVCVVSSLMIACEPQRAKGDAFFFSLHTGVECQVVLGPLERLPPGTTPEATSAVHGTKCCALVLRTASCPISMAGPIAVRSTQFGAVERVVVLDHTML
jgi:hypothetical protein